MSGSPSGPTPTVASTVYGVTSVMYPQAGNGNFQGIASIAIPSSPFWYQANVPMGSSSQGEIRMPVDLWHELPRGQRDELRAASSGLYEDGREVVIVVPQDRAERVAREMLAWYFVEWSGSVRLSPEACRLLEHWDLSELRWMAVSYNEDHMEGGAILLNFRTHELAAAVAKEVREYVIAKKASIDEWGRGHYATEPAPAPANEFEAVEDVALRAAGSRRPDCTVWRAGPEPGTFPLPIRPMDYSKINAARY